MNRVSYKEWGFKDDRMFNICSAFSYFLGSMQLFFANICSASFKE